MKIINFASHIGQDVKKYGPLIGMLIGVCVLATLMLLAVSYVIGNAVAYVILEVAGQETLTHEGAISLGMDTIIFAAFIAFMLWGAYGIFRDLIVWLKKAWRDS
mgnify:CR=1 FL=1